MAHSTRGFERERHHRRDSHVECTTIGDSTTTRDTRAAAVTGDMPGQCSGPDAASSPT